MSMSQQPHFYGCSSYGIRRVSYPLFIISPPLHAQKCDAFSERRLMRSSLGKNENSGFGGGFSRYNQHNVEHAGLLLANQYPSLCAEQGIITQASS